MSSRHSSHSRTSSRASSHSPAGRRPRRRLAMQQQQALPRTPERREHQEATPPAMTLDEVSRAITKITNLLQQQARQAVTVVAPQKPPCDIKRPRPDPDFDWSRLRQPTTTNFPDMGEGKVQRIAAGLLAKLPTLTGRDRNEVSFLLTVASDYPSLPEQIAHAVYQRFILLYIAVYHGWPSAIAATDSDVFEGCVPTGFSTTSTSPFPVEPPPQQPVDVDPPPRRTQQPARARGGRRRGGFNDALAQQQQ